MAKYIPIEPGHLEDYVDIWLEFAVGVNPYIDEEESRQKMLDYLSQTKLTKGAALQLGGIVKDTETYYGRHDV